MNDKGRKKLMEREEWQRYKYTASWAA